MEGLAPLDQTIRGRTVIRTEIIAPAVARPATRDVPDPCALAEAIEAWITGDGSRFTAEGLRLLDNRAGRGGHRQWPYWRARRLARICRELADGAATVTEACTRLGLAPDLAYDFLRPLARALADTRPLVDDDDQRANDGE